MQFVTGITLILETGEEIGLHSYDIGKVDVSGVMDVVHKIGDNIVQFKQADSIFIMLLPGVNCPYRPFGIGNETTIFNRLLEGHSNLSYYGPICERRNRRDFCPRRRRSGDLSGR